MDLKDLIEKEIAKGTSRRLLAKKVGVSLGTVQNILLGDTEIKNSTLEKFSRYFKEKMSPPTSPFPESMKDKYIALLEEKVQHLEEKMATLTKEWDGKDRRVHQIWPNDKA